METKVVKISSKERELFTDDEIFSIKMCADIIASGGLVVFPTETVYGLGGDATNPKAAEKIYSAKGRPSDNPLIIHIEKPEDAEFYAYTNDLYYKLAKRFMPGPLTVVLKSKNSIPKETRGGLGTVAIRCPVNPIARELIAMSGVAIAAPSANLSGSPSPTKVNHVIDDMMGRVDAIIDGGESDFGLESTIVKIEDDGRLCLLRPGKITVDELSQIASVTIAGAVVNKLGEGEVAISPGMKYRHYAPSAPLVLVDGSAEQTVEYIISKGYTKVALLCYSEHIEYLSKALQNAILFDLGDSSSEVDHAHRLFDLLREADKHELEIIFAPLPKKTGIGLALYNRMIRAAAHTIIKL